MTNTILPITGVIWSVLTALQYNASKAGVVQLAKCLSVEWVDFCRVNCISPGFIATEILDHHPKEWREKWNEMIPARRMAQTYELKGVCISIVDTCILLIA